MLLLHQIGSVKIGEVVRYTVTYTPSQDRILPSPEKLHLRVRNTSAIALRAAFVHGPYNLCVAAYPATFNPNHKFPNPHRYGVPECEPMIKAGGSWQCELVVPEHIRQSAGTGGNGQYFGGGSGHNANNDGCETAETESATWVVEVSSQVIFSTSAVVGYEIVLARDEKSLTLSSSLPVIGGTAQVPQPGKISDHQYEGYYDDHASGGSSRNQHQHQHQHHHYHGQQPKGVFSRAVRLKVEDTAALWNTPRLPGWDYGTKLSALEKADKVRQRNKGASTNTTERPSSRPTTPARDTERNEKPAEKQEKVHLVVLTHGLHSNLGADLLYLKESIDATVKQAKVDAKERRAREREARKAKAAAERGDSPDEPPKSKTGHADQAADEQGDEEDEEDEEVIVRGFSGNATRTERGIKYLGKRLARYVLSTCYPDQPYLPSMKGAPDSAATVTATTTTTTATPVNKADGERKPTFKQGDAQHKEQAETQRPFKVTSISFIGHSLGGLVQTYAIAYIQKHSPRFFDLIQPINFVTLATPFLGLSNENPLYVKFALDFGLVGRTGQDLGLTWRPPTIARSGWGAIVSNLGESAHKRVIGESRPESKPLLRILPTGPAHTALRKFRNRTIYSNVVNDGIVPLRTSCLLFLDWQGLGRVEKARRDAGLVETLVGAGWAELTGANVTGARREVRQLPAEEDRRNNSRKNNKTTHDNNNKSKRKNNSGQHQLPEHDGSGIATPTAPENASEVPQPSANAIVEDDKASLRSVGTPYAEPSGPDTETTESPYSSNPFAGFFAFFKSSSNNNSDSQQTPTSPLTPKQNKIYRRSQTIKFDEETSINASASSVGSSGNHNNNSNNNRVTSGQEYEHDVDGLTAPPRTTVFESAHDLINPTLPSTGYILDPSKRPRTIFHDRVYHPSDIPPPPLKKKATGSTGSHVLRRRTTSQSTTATTASSSTDTKDYGPAPASEAADNNSSNNNTASSSPYFGHGHGHGHGIGRGVTREDSTISTKDYDDTVHTNPDKASDQEVDGSQMRVEEKIARAYHRGVSWRKVLVKVEPDAHNNIIVRRMFANAFGWPVVKHIVDAHFSDAAAVRSRVDEEGGEERALDISQPPDQFGGEIKLDEGGTGATEPAKETVTQNTARKEEEKVGSGQQKGQTDGEGKGEDEGEDEGEGESPPKRVERSESLAREAEDTVPELPSSNVSWTDGSPSSPGATGGGGGGGSPPRSVPQTTTAAASTSGDTPTAGSGGHDTLPPRGHLHTHRDSFTWSDGDWIDTDEEDSSAGGKSPLPPPSPTPETAVTAAAASRAGNGSGEMLLSPTMLSPTAQQHHRRHHHHQPQQSSGKTTVANEDDKVKSPPRSLSPSGSGSSGSGSGSGWNWTEKIVGKGGKQKGAGGSASPTTPTLQVDTSLEGKK